MAVALEVKLEQPEDALVAWSEVPLREDVPTTSYDIVEEVFLRNLHAKLMARIAFAFEWYAVVSSWAKTQR